MRIKLKRLWVNTVYNVYGYNISHLPKWFKWVNRKISGGGFIYFDKFPFPLIGKETKRVFRHFDEEWYCETTFYPADTPSLSVSDIVDTQPLR